MEKKYTTGVSDLGRHWQNTIIWGGVCWTGLIILATVSVVSSMPDYSFVYLGTAVIQSDINYNE